VQYLGSLGDRPVRGNTGFHAPKMRVFQIAQSISVSGALSARV